MLRKSLQGLPGVAGTWGLCPPGVGLPPCEMVWGWGEKVSKASSSPTFQGILQAGPQDKCGQEWIPGPIHSPHHGGSAVRLLDKELGPVGLFC